MKYTKEFIIRMVKKKKNNEEIPYNPNFRSAQRWHEKIRRWERIYDKLGEKGLEHNKPHLTFEEKLKLISRIENGETMQEVAFSVGRQCAAISNWYKIYRQYGIDGLKSLKKGRKKEMTKPSNNKNKTELEKLREENEYLKAENEYLKKLRALIQEEEKDRPPNRK